MSFVILGILRLLGPTTIYSLNKQFEQSISLFYRASLGSIRAALTGMLARGEISFETTSEGGRQKKVYSLTETGEQAFSAWMLAPLGASNTETVALSKVHFLGLLDSQHDRQTVLTNIIERFTQDFVDLETLKHNLDAQAGEDELPLIDRYRIATLQYGLEANKLSIDYFTRLLAQA